MAIPARLARQVALAAELNPQVNAFTSLTSRADIERQYAASQAHERDTKGKGKAKATNEVLRGRSVAVKDNFVTGPSPGSSSSPSGSGKGEGAAEHAATTCASRMLADYKSPFEATVVRLLREQGGVVVGKTNMDEFGMGSATVHSSFGPTLNPSSPHGLFHALDPAFSAERRVAGGSSGGSAAAVAAGMADFALASDTGGSTRLPASYTGTVGFKPSYGLLSRYGLVAYASSLDTVGIVGERGKAGEVVQVADSLSAYDPQDPTSAPLFARERAEKAHREVRDRLADSGGGKGKALEGVRVGVPADLFPLPSSSPLLSPLGPLRSFLTLLQSDLGATLVPVRLRTAPAALSAYYVIASAEASSNLARYRGVEYGFRAPDDDPDHTEDGDDKLPLFAKTRSLGFGKEVKKRILLGTFALSAEAFDNYFLQAQRVRRLLQDEIDSLFRVPNPLRPLSSSLSPSGRRQQEGVDFLVHPSAMSTAPLLSSYLSPSSTSSPSSSSSSPSTSPTQANSRDAYIQDLLSLPASLAGLPALSIPAGRSEEDGWPVGMTLVGQWGSDGAVGEVGARVEEGLRRRREGREGR
ncbi:hypothetical protein JCM11251_005657 [Rhodosporidiobolus azoricus]